MKLLRKRAALATLGMTAALIGIGVPTAIVFATKADNSKDIGKNIKAELENSFLDAVNIISVDDSSEINSGKLDQHIKKLNEYKKSLNRLEKEYLAFAKTKIPVYGILNDVIESSMRFKEFSDFTDIADEAVGAIRVSNWDKLEELLFDTKNFGKNKLLSKSYGIERNEISGDNFKILGDDKDSNGKLIEDRELTNNIKNSFLSFGEDLNELKSHVVPAEIQKVYTKQIISVLNMMSGNRYSMTSGPDSAKIVSSPNDEPNNSVIYFIDKIRKMADDSYTNTGHLAAKSLLDVWNNQMIPAWRNRYKKIEFFFDNKHNPLNEQGWTGDRSISDAFSMHERYIESKSKDNTLQDIISSFISGDKTDIDMTKSSISSWLNVYVDASSTAGSKNRFITNWEFLKIFFGDIFQDKVYGPSDPNYAATPEYSNASKEEQDKMNALYRIRTVDSKMVWTSDSLSQLVINKMTSGSNAQYSAYFYWYYTIGNLFDDGVRHKADQTQYKLAGNELPTGYYRIAWDEKTSKDVIKSANLKEQLFDDTALNNAYYRMNDVRVKYENEIELLNRDRFRLGINLKKIDAIKNKYHINNDWSIKINSFTDREIGQSKIDAIKSLMVMDSKTKEYKTNTNDYDIVNGYIYPKTEDWMLGTSDTIGLNKIELVKDSKMSEWQDDLKDFIKFKPEYKINESEEAVNVEVKWKIIKDDLGGWND